MPAHAKRVSWLDRKEPMDVATLTTDVAVCSWARPLEIKERSHSAVQLRVPVIKPVMLTDFAPKPDASHLGGFWYCFFKESHGVLDCADGSVPSGAIYCWVLRIHSERRASPGSTRAARAAGSQLASNDTTSSVTMTAASTTGSRGETSNNSGDIHRPAARAARRPSATPMPTTRRLSPTTRRATSGVRAPRAIRTPISCVRCATLCAITPYNPTAAKRSASPPNVANMVA